MCVDFIETPDQITLHLPTRLAFEHIDCFKNAYRRLEASGQPILIDASSLFDLDFAGLGMLIKFKKEVAVDLPVYWHNSSEYADRIFDACRLGRFFEKVASG